MKREKIFKFVLFFFKETKILCETMKMKNRELDEV